MLQLAGGAIQDQPAPVLRSVKPTDTRMVVHGSLTAAPDSTYTVEMFVGDVPNGTVMVTTDSTGLAHFKATVDHVGLLTATATDALGNTSEFSNAINPGAVFGPFDLSRLRS